MSDDEYYDDEYADFHDILYDADPDPDLADDLAEHAAHSPVYFDNPNEEAREYFSDWEYYSDDYFDDDPGLLGNATTYRTGIIPASESNQRSIKRGRKRKLSEVGTSLDSDTKEAQALKACIQGTVWKAQSPELAEDYRQGYFKPVALRLSKTIMKSAYSRRQGFGTGRELKDETWANDLSLADMGLRTETSMDRPLSAGIEGKDDLEEEDEDDTGDIEGGVEDGNIDEDILIGQALVEEEIGISGSGGSKRSREDDNEAQEQRSDNVPVDDSENEGEQQRRKRRKMFESESGTESKSSANTPETSIDSAPTGTAMDIEPALPTEPPKRGRGRPRKTPVTTDTKHAPFHASRDVDKRVSERKVSSATASTASTRAKSATVSTAASSGVSNGKSGMSKVTKTARQTRSQRK